MIQKKGWLILSGVLAVIVIYLLATYNSLVRKEENVKRDWGNLQTTYQRRNDLVPNLVSVVKGASTYEKNVLEQLAEARAKAAQLSFSGDVNFAEYQKLEQTQGEVATSVNNVLGVVENYPDLKATKNFLYLQTQLEGTERRIKIARNDFNAAVASYNKVARKFPGNIAARIFGFRPKDGFQASQGADLAPTINFKK